MKKKTNRPKTALAVFTPDTETMNSLASSSGSSDLVLLDFCFPRSLPNCSASNVATEDETPGSQATKEPATLPEEIAFIILLAGRLMREVRCGGITELVVRLIISWEAPNRPLNRGRSIDGLSDSNNELAIFSFPKAKMPSSPLSKNTRNA
ncbi:MAG: hypothetical protein A4E23_01486 [Methanomethylovorans sp. PtaU1.Bin073]|nr:MAG: hypothetical protein A4E23_01486 [Methanomethylovorans sp. PtaU1.Bin073]